jgi:hypothetical protein
MNLKPGGCPLYLDLQNPICRWDAEPGQALSENWIESQSIIGSAQVTARLNVVRSAPAQTTPIHTVSVTIVPTRDQKAAMLQGAAKLLATNDVQDFPSSSYLSHHEARAETREDRAEPELTHLTITLPDPVFDRVWRELDSGRQNKVLRVGAMAHCLMEEHWMEQYYLRPGSMNVVKPSGIAVFAGGSLQAGATP